MEHAFSILDARLPHCHLFIVSEPGCPVRHHADRLRAHMAGVWTVPSLALAGAMAAPLGEQAIALVSADMFADPDHALPLLAGFRAANPALRMVVASQRFDRHGFDGGCSHADALLRLPAGPVGVTLALGAAMTNHARALVEDRAAQAAVAAQGKAEAACAPDARRRLRGGRATIEPRLQLSCRCLKTGRAVGVS
ncbi:hypothetical protein [Roseicyclus persicicus]|uniref:Uncharacterized protein n=1 Tax=Roseicyclus persicicus TaxID=2650661 RepID=A0A7X6JVZ8_9RHOB|nr:hypothetical protein [Roseibacterium persicicum]NKX43200.1 hypothetical protein [Roseibacterium persicicum]